ncbi:hypothetical protein QBC35DRAFT_540527 [Podospora australis]|uniref:Ig-like domain-containing protein n=1 Tax=Podospora australis TaxID=1536484 RepID=A0AAN7AFY5_9PEZI|nr:hypothetical protein QBC35DRAFT_540527 [Podospora australis]
MLSQLLWLAASAALVSGQGQPTSGTGCTTLSFTLPSWFVQDLTYTDEKATFRISNRATNFTGAASCQVAQKGWNSCAIASNSSTVTTDKDSIEARVQIHGTLAVLLSFAASGTANVTLDNTKIPNQAAISPLLIKGSLSSPVAITPLYGAGPQGHDNKGCSAAAQNPVWNISGIYYLDRPGDGIYSAPSRIFNLHITNPATGYEAGCMYGALTTEPTESSLVCSGNEFGDLDGARYTPSTSGSWDPATYRFSMNQTWYCDDVDPSKPIAITATASAILPLVCSTQPIPTPDSDSPSNSTLTQTICPENPDVALQGTLLTTTTLAPYSLEAPVPRADGCTISSILRPTWSFSAFEIASSNPEDPSAWESVTFEIILATNNRGFQFPIPISFRKDPTKEWFPCEIGPDGENDRPLFPYKCEAQFDAATKELKLKADWECKEFDEEHPINFSGISTTTIKGDLECSKYQGLSYCTTTDTALAWQAPIVNVTWKSAA